ncbi:signal peptidase II [Mycoplasmoides pirum]|uniref:signal peptidase II n=1 Tax=Mycoplasmoides pirum TaxID=2122 RepID=UPI00048426E1|nr:signal peptidase II [Mycoplasmoides pirum]
MIKKHTLKTKFLLTKIKEFFLTNNTKKIILIKIIIFLISLCLILGIIFGLRNRFYLFVNKGIIENTGFININVITNSGIGFGQLQDSVALVYFLQSFIMVLVFIGFIFNKKIDILIPLAMIIAGSLGNILDRATSYLIPYSNSVSNVVLDYFQFWFGGAIFNFADSSIICGFIALFITLIIRTIIEWKKEHKEHKKINEAKKETFEDKIKK